MLLMKNRKKGRVNTKEPRTQAWVVWRAVKRSSSVSLAGKNVENIADESRMGASMAHT
jgi:hypothetical protein